ncbi:hypothetical protein [Nocardiopsis composta]|uniref:Cobyrinic acid a,c-diamide synthase n=1 Tax=Nocardiopsis composta TaxID=157465 RepID=A0A7W8QSP8_9ACTN|nr:hypothetical protein [Nocardiopsis composta]MBB5435883.1 hypothetical protein [Nocardiopsis composta]
MAKQRPRRVTLPGADEMFFRSSDPAGAEPEPAAPAGAGAPEAGPAGAPAERPKPLRRRAPKPSGRERHDEKITVYVSAAELLALEQTRLALRAEYGLSADRGRIVREAVGVLLADFEENGDASMLVRRLSN